VSAWKTPESNNLISVLDGCSIFSYYLPSNIMYWLFGWKYWVISLEVPALVNEQNEQIDEEKPVERKERFWTERRYKVLNWIGIAVNTGFCFWVAYTRYLKSWMKYHGGATPKVIWMMTYVSWSLTFLLIVSAAFLGDALRRLKQQFSKDKRLALNLKTMRLHVTALFFHTFFLILNQTVAFLVYLHPTSNNQLYINLSRIVVNFSNGVSLTIVIYLFLQFAKPVSLKQEVKEDSDSDYEEEFDRIRDPNMDMIYYVKNMPKMQRLEEVDLNIDSDKTVAEYLFEEGQRDGTFVMEDHLGQDNKIDGFTDRMTTKWGEEETKLRLAIYVSFVKDSDTYSFRKKVKKHRQSVVRMSVLSRNTGRSSAINGD
jgi:hypothetical protein